MKKCIILTCLCVLYFIPTTYGAIYELPVSGNITVKDSGGDDTFETITAYSEIKVHWKNVDGMSQRWKCRGIIEFDLEPFFPLRRAETAILKFCTNQRSNRPEIQFWGYRGDGITELSDANRGDVLITTQIIDDLDTWEVDLTSFVNSQIRQGNRFIGINLRESSEGKTDNTYDNEVTFKGYQSTDPVFCGVKLILSTDTGDPVTPADTLYQHNFNWGLPGSDLGFQFKSSDSYGRMQIVNDSLLRMDMDYFFSNYTRNEMDWVVDLEGAGGIILRFFQSDLGDEIQSLPDSFTGGSDGDGVSISSDGNTWYTVTNADALDVGAAGQIFSIDLDAEVARIQTDFDPAFQYGPLFHIRFQQYDDHSYLDNDGRDWGYLLITGDPLGSETDISLSMTSSTNSVDAGSEITYDLNYENLGTEKAVGLVLSGTLPPESYIISASTGCERAGDSFTCYVGTVDPGAGGVRQLVISPMTEGLHDFTATATAHRPDPVPGNNEVSETIDVLPMPNKPPMVQIRVAPSGQLPENSTVTAELIHLFDPNATDSHTLDWNFGDGTTLQGDGPFDHTYLDNGDFTFSLSATDSGGLTGSSSRSITITNVPPTVEAGPDASVDMYSVIHFSGQFTDPGPLDTHTISWDFGDGHQSEGSLTPSHTYSQAGTFTVTLSVTDNDGGVGTDTLSVTVDPYYSLDVIPTETITLAGQEGGPFNPVCGAYTLNNHSDTALDWSVSISETWAEASIQNGNLASGASQAVDICLNSQGQALSAGTYTADIIFEETGSGLTYTRLLTLSVSEAPATLPFEFDFSQGLPDQDDGWTYYSSHASFGRIQTVGGRMRMDVAQDGNNNLNEAVVNLNLTGARQVTFEFFQSDHGDESTPLPESFTGHYNGDGVSVSIDGQTWYRAVDSSLLEVSSSGQNYLINLDDLVTAIRNNFDPDFDYTDTFRIKFQQYDNYTYPSDGREWDNIRISGLTSYLTVTPVEDVSINVPESEASNPGCRTYLLTNSGTSEITWNASVSEAWLSLNISSGTLSPGADAALEVCWNTSGFLVGEQRNGIISISDSSASGFQERNLTLKVIPENSSLPYEQNFDLGKPGTDQGWSYYSSNNANGRIEVVSERLRMDVMNSGSFNLNEAVLSLDLTGQSKVTLSFFHSESYDENHPMNAIFTGHANADGVAVSVDNTNWYRILDAADLDVGTFGKTFNIDLDAEIDRIQNQYDPNFNYGPEFLIKFQQYDNYSYTSDGREWDSISITAQ